MENPEACLEVFNNALVYATDTSDSSAFPQQINPDFDPSKATGVAELIASVLLLLPRTTWMGAVFAFGIIAGAILSHLFVLGIEIMDDGGYLFVLGLIVFVSAGILIWMHKTEIPFLNKLTK